MYKMNFVCYIFSYIPNSEEDVGFSNGNAKIFFWLIMKIYERQTFPGGVIGLYFVSIMPK